MRVSLKWLGEFVHIDVPIRKLVELLDLSGTKVEAVHRGGTQIHGVVVAEVVDIADHPDADNLTLVDVRVESDLHQRVVCGVRNYEVGDRVPLATVGSRLGEMEIAERKIRGQLSQGMLCSPAELNISRDHSGIFVLPPDAPLGAEVSEIFEFDAPVLELEITPNRPDCMGMIGVAREVAALLGTELVRPTPDVAPDEGVGMPVEVEVRDPQGCPRYLARYVEGVTVGPSPVNVVRRLLSAGVRPISNIVDATNYVMLETGQPLHAFDADNVSDRKIVVRRAAGAGMFAGSERLNTLDGAERELHADDLLIADPAKPLALAGVMGGEHSEVSEQTTAVILESACFDPPTIAYMSRRHQVRTEASARFERGTDPEGVVFAAGRAAGLMARIAGARVSPKTVDVRVPPSEPRQLSLRPARTNAVIGMDIRPDVQAARLRSIELSVTERNGSLLVEVPSFRRDLTREIDLVEEVARLVGFESIPSAIPPGKAGRLEPDQIFERRLKNTLSALGLHEAWSSPFMATRELDDLGLPKDHPARDFVRLSNPMTEDEEGLRTTLLPGLLRAVAGNVSHQAAAVALYEVARVYEPSSEVLPREAPVLAAACWGGRTRRHWSGSERTWDFYEMKGLVESAVAALGLGDLQFRATQGAPFHPTRAARVARGEKPIGVVGELHPETCEKFDIPEQTVVMEVALSPLLAALPERVKAADLPRFPPVLIDIAVVVEEQIAAADVEAVIWEHGRPEVAAVSLFDLYRGDQIPSGHKSLAYSLEMRSPDRTLTDDDAAQARNRIMNGLQERFGARLRG